MCGSPMRTGSPPAATAGRSGSRVVPPDRRRPPFTGVPRATWANLETGGGNPTLAVLHRVAQALQVPLDETHRRAARGVPLLCAREAAREEAWQRDAAQPPARSTSRDGPGPDGASPAVAAYRRAAHARNPRVPRVRSG